MDIIGKTKSFVLKSKRVWYALSKPSKKEFTTITKISAVGIAILGIMGFIIAVIITAFF